MQRPWIITIDGPAGSGKSTLGELLARHLGYLYFDTGVMYRALAWVALERAVDLQSAEMLIDLAHQTVIEVQSPHQDDGRPYTVYADQHDVTWAIRTPAVDRTVSLVARVAGVRREMVRQQQVIGRRGQVVMVGRDIGTIVMPDAPLKIYLEASLDERARRRVKEQQERGLAVDIAQVRADLARRDALDDHVLVAAPDAVVLSSDGVAPADVLTRVLALFADNTPEPRRGYGL
ncbi:MAG: (d)CMP kinase [Chloroflexaceae bacterium]|nr:(d)CMP kinase [Chloroflexaceae bacterium]